jgi:DNA-binding transcriptional MerR regulator
MPLFAKKKTAAGALTDQIASMRQQGMPNDQIIQTLQSQGQDPSQIFDAMNQMDQGAPPGAQPAPGMPPPGAPPGMPPPGAQPGAPEQMQDQYGGGEAYGAPLEDKEKIEEVAEAIIDEKWKDLLKDINKISEWNHKTETRLSKIETEIKSIKENFDSLHKGILGKITEYDNNLVNVGTEIKAMEKVFQKILPTFTDNVNKLSRITQGVKAPPPKKK